MSTDDKDELECGCCEGIRLVTPIPLNNPPALDTILYRSGTHGRFKESMLALISRRSELTDLTTRDDDDSTMALFDAWAMVLDILSFYQERIANEGYLRSAKERLSILELARSIGYELSPGVAAGTHLAFTVEDAPTTPRKVIIEAGAQAQSLPGQDEQAQTFETVQKIEARAAWNEILARVSKFVAPSSGDTSVYLKSDALGIQEGDLLLFINPLAVNPEVSDQWDIRIVHTVIEESSSDRTLVSWQAPLEANRALWVDYVVVDVFLFHERASVFGHNAPDWRTISDDVRKNFVPKETTVNDFNDWPNFTIYSPSHTETQELSPEVVYATAEDVYNAALSGGEFVAKQTRKVATSAIPNGIVASGSAATSTLNFIYEARKAFAENVGIEMDNLLDAPDTYIDEHYVTPLREVVRAFVDLAKEILPGPGSLDIGTDGTKALTNLLRFNVDDLWPFDDSDDAKENAEKAIQEIETVINGIIRAVKREFNNPLATNPSHASPETLDTIKRLAQNIEKLVLNNPLFLPFKLRNNVDLGDSSSASYDQSPSGRLASSVALAGRALTDIPQTATEAAAAGIVSTMVSTMVDTVYNLVPSEDQTPEAIGFVALLGAKLAELAIATPVHEVSEVIQAIANGDFLTESGNLVGDVLAEIQFAADGDLGSQANLLAHAISFAGTGLVTAGVLGGGVIVAGGESVALISGYGGLLAAGAATILAPALLSAGPVLLASIALAPDAAKGAVKSVTEIEKRVLEALTPKEVERGPIENIVAFPKKIDLDDVYPEIQKESWLLLSVSSEQRLYWITDTVEASRTDFVLTSKTTRATLRGPDLKPFKHKVRAATVFAESEKVEVAEQPLDELLTGNQIWLAEHNLGLAVEQCIGISGIDHVTSDDASEIAMIKAISKKQDSTLLTLEKDLQNPYRRASVRLNANVAQATHGESRQLVLGSGDGAIPFQAFHFLGNKQRLTYISPPNSSGVNSTLEVYVDGVLWKEAPFFYQQPPHGEVYKTQIADDGQVTVKFGDGVHGTRLPSGFENVVASYREGIGLEGAVAARQISLLMKAPLGVKAVLNPAAPSGAGDPEHLDQARENAPLTVLTLDRIVSLLDFEHFARAYPGIAKAKADWVWRGASRVVFVTLAADEGKPLIPSSPFFENLKSSIRDAGNPTQLFTLEPFEARDFYVTIRVRLHARYEREQVKSDIQHVLHDAYSFTRRSFGQGVSKSELIAHVQSIEGVEYLTLESLGFLAGSPPANYLPARCARWDGGAIRPAQLLTLHENGLTLKEFN